LPVSLSTTVIASRPVPACSAVAHGPDNPASQAPTTRAKHGRKWCRLERVFTEFFPQSRKRQRPGAPDMPWRWGPLLRQDQPEPVTAVGSVVTYQVCWGNGYSVSRGHPRPYAPKSLRLQVPACSGRWRFDDAPPRSETHDLDLYSYCYQYPRWPAFVKRPAAIMFPEFEPTSKKLAVPGQRSPPCLIRG
jgi:hypothetical protein